MSSRRSKPGERRERIRRRGAREHMNQSSHDLKALLKSAKADVAAVSRGMEEVGLAPDKGSGGGAQKIDEAPRRSLKPTKSRIEMRKEKTVEFKAVVQQMYANSEISTLEKEHLERMLWQNRYDEVGEFVDSRKKPGHRQREDTRTLSSPSAPKSQRKGLRGNNIMDGYGVEWSNEDETFYSTGGSATTFTLCLKNVGSKAWPKAATLNNQGGELEDIAWRKRPLPELRPGATHDVTVHCQTPSSGGKIMHYFQVELSVPEDEVRVVGDMIGVMITCSVLGKIENKKKRPTGLRLRSSSSSSPRNRTLSLEGKSMWREATPDSPVHRPKREQSEEVSQIMNAFGGKSAAGEIQLPGLVTIPGVPMHPAGKAREMAARGMFRAGRK